MKIPNLIIVALPDCCLICKNYDDNNVYCKKYHTAVSPNTICDSFESFQRSNEK